MISTRKNRLDPSLLESKDLKCLIQLLSTQGTPFLIDEKGQRIDLPKPGYTQLLRILRLMQQGRAVVMLPEDETFTTQAAANYLGMSRQHVVNLMEGGQLPFHRVGSHRRVSFLDLTRFEKQRDHERRASLDHLTKEVDQVDLFEESYTGSPD